VLSTNLAYILRKKQNSLKATTLKLFLELKIQPLSFFNYPIFQGLLWRMVEAICAGLMIDNIWPHYNLSEYHKHSVRAPFVLAWIFFITLLGLSVAGWISESIYNAGIMGNASHSHTFSDAILHGSEICQHFALRFNQAYEAVLLALCLSCLGVSLQAWLHISSSVSLQSQLTNVADLNVQKTDSGEKQRLQKVCIHSPTNMLAVCTTILANLCNNIHRTLTCSSCLRFLRLWLFSSSFALFYTQPAFTLGQSLRPLIQAGALHTLP
jgi:hypothetical protein